MKARFDSARILVVACALVSTPLLAGDSGAPPAGPTVVAGSNLPQENAADESNRSSVNQAAESAGQYVSPWLGEVLKLLEANVDDSVLLAFIDKSGSFNLGAGEIIRLTKSGLRSDVLTLMLQHDAELAAGLRPEPAPPTKAVLPKFLIRKSKVIAASPTPAVGESESIVNPSPAPDYAALMRILAGSREVAVERAGRPPVREPIAVPLTSTIVVYRTPGRVPNTVSLEMFPE